MINHTCILNRYLAGIWQEISTEFGLYSFRRGNEITCYGSQADLEAAWELLKERSDIVPKFEL